MTEEAAKGESHDIVATDMGELMSRPTHDFRFNALIFYGNKPIPEELAHEFDEAMSKYENGHLFYWSDLWRKIRDSGLEWTDYIPLRPNGEPRWSLGRCNTIFVIGEKFLPEPPESELRVYENLDFSHYEVVRSFEDEEAHRLLESANRAKITVAEFVKIIKELKGELERKKSIKVIACAHCDHLIADIEDEGCPWCISEVAENRIKKLQKVLECIRDGEDLDSGLRAECDRALTEV